MKTPGQLLGRALPLTLTDGKFCRIDFGSTGDLGGAKPLPVQFGGPAPPLLQLFLASMWSHASYYRRLKAMKF